MVTKAGLTVVNYSMIQNHVHFSQSFIRIKSIQTPINNPCLLFEYKNTPNSLFVHLKKPPSKKLAALSRGFFIFWHTTRNLFPKLWRAERIGTLWQKHQQNGLLSVLQQECGMYTQIIKKEEDNQKSLTHQGPYTVHIFVPGELIIYWEPLKWSR